MSLIERAVSRLAEAAPKDAEPPNKAASREAEYRTSIEALADRLGYGSLDTPTVPPEAAPAQASHASTTVPKPAPVAPPQREAQPAPSAGREPVRIHLEALRARGMVVPSGAATQASQEFRLIKRPLLANALGRAGREPVRNGRRIMVTSALPGEGKSYCAINLAMSIASERDHGVILVDADVARPSILRELGIHADAGLMDWLVDGRPDISELVLATNVDKLSIMSAGRRDEHATELLASDGMGRLLDQLTDRYPDAILIFDSPPLLATTEARVLASYMGQIVMVVEAGRTPRDTVTQALSTIESNEIIGLVLNKAHNVDTSSYYQGYGYGAA